MFVLSTNPTFSEIPLKENFSSGFAVELFINAIVQFTRFPFLFRLLKGKDGLVGNGGFSLRKISTHVKYAEIYANSVKTLQLNEDLFWSKYVAAKHQNFTIPLIKEALSFAVENDPGNAFKMLNDTLPFGCHAWYKHDRISWDVIFNKAGFDPAQIPIG